MSWSETRDFGPARNRNDRGPSLARGMTGWILRANDDQEPRRFPETLRLLDLQLTGDLVALHRRGLGVRRVLARQDLIFTRRQRDRAIVQAIDLREARRI